MYNMLDGIQYPIAAGVGAVIGCLITVLVAVIGIWFPGVFAWLWVPPVAGTVVGLIAASYAK